MTHRVTEIRSGAASFGIEHDYTNQRSRWSTTCDKCKRHDVLHLAENVPANVLANKFRLRGWTMTKNRAPVCKQCTKEHRMNKPVQIGPDPKIARKIYALLDEHFDDHKRLYRGAWSDEAVAKKLDVSVEVVISIRRAAYGELSEDPKVQRLRDDIELLRMELDEELAKLKIDHLRIEGLLRTKIDELELQLPARNKKAAG